MNIFKKHKAIKSMQRHKGFTLLDVLLGIVVFAVGMLALASLQTNLTRSSVDANTRTVATNIGEEILERLRSFRVLGTDSTGELFAFDDIDEDYVETLLPTLRGQTGNTLTELGQRFTIDGTVDNFVFNADQTGVSLTTDTRPDYKRVTLTISWDSAQQFQVDEDTQVTSEEIGSGSVTLSGIIPGIPSLGSAVIASVDEDGLGGIPVDYTPGQLPDVLPINLDGTKFKESTRPKPKVIRSDYIVETWFDVVTYNKLSESASQYLRREEFAVVACECTLRGPVGVDGDGFLPTTWNGEEYVEGEWVRKNFGESANNQQSQYCEPCCRDHHDDPNSVTGDDLYRPWTDAVHKHWLPTSQGWVEATQPGDDYLEVCRMVRKDGFMRVAQDFNQAGMLATRQAYFLDSSNISTYSAHVISEAESHFNNGNNAYSTALKLPGDASNNPVLLPRVNDLAKFDQLVSRALYTDYINTDLNTAIGCLEPTYNAACAPEGVRKPIEILPFYEIQTTWLSFWDENVSGDPVRITSETIATDNSHSRGEAIVVNEVPADVTGNTYMHRGNVGLTSTDPIDGDYDNNVETSDIYISTYGGGNVSPKPHGISGTLTGVDQIKASDATFIPTSTGVYCTWDVNSYECSYDGNVVTSPSFSVTGYRKNKDAWVCDMSGNPNLIINNDPVTGRADFDLSGVGAAKLTGISLIFQGSECNY